MRLLDDKEIESTSGGFILVALEVGVLLYAAADIGWQFAQGVRDGYNGK